MTSDKRPLNELIDEMLKEQNYHPRDYSFRLITQRYPKNHMKHLISQQICRHVKTEDVQNIYMDCTQLVMAEGEITCKSK
jgi:hypothetical protein